MNNLSAAVQAWLNKHSNRDKFILFLIGFIFLYFIFFMLFQKQLRSSRIQMQEQIANMQMQQMTQRLQIATIQIAIKNPKTGPMFIEQKKLTAQLNQLQQEISGLQPRVVTSDELAVIIEKILAQQVYGTNLISFKELPDQPWPPPKETDKTNPEEKNTSTTGIYQHIFEIVFQNDYLNTINYLQALEKTSNTLYWDKIEYKVLAYPKAQVTVQFHILSGTQS